MIFAVICFGLPFLSGVGLFMSIYNPNPFYGNPLFWAPFTGVFLMTTYLLLRRKT